MKRDKILIEKRRRKIAILFETKKEKGTSYKVAIIEIAEAFTISVLTVRKEITKANKSNHSAVFGGIYTDSQ